MHLRASLAAFAAVVAVTPLFGCNFILNPDGDGILRCDNADECDVPLAEALADNRGQSRCGAAAGGGGGFTESQDNKVCSVIDKEDVGCNPNVFTMNPDSPVSVAWAKATATSNAAYTPCLDGTEGCAPIGGTTCNAGLEVRTYAGLYAASSSAKPMVDNELKVCAKPGATAVAPNLGIRGFDVLDQHCRAYFCDQSFVCDTSNSGGRCVRCDPKQPYGEGGCGTVYLQGAPSTVYTSKDAVEDADCQTKANADGTKFGEPVVVAP